MNETFSRDAVAERVLAPHSFRYRVAAKRLTPFILTQRLAFGERLFGLF